MKTRTLAIAGMWTAVVCVMALISIPTQPVPIILANFAILLTGALFSPRYAVMIAVAYLILGAAGVPVFAGMKSGVGVLFGMTGGYLLSYPLMALIVSLCTRMRRHNKVMIGMGMVLAMLVCYGLGTAWYVVVAESAWSTAFMVCVVPFLIVDLTKIVLAWILGVLLRQTALKKYLI